MFGGKKKPKEQKSVPIEDVKKMASRGMSDKDIIKELKQRGYNYDEIERAMLQAVKEGVNDEPSQMPGGAPPQDLFGTAVGGEELFAPQQQQQQEFELPSLDQTSEDETSAILEELIEGVIEEKWHGFEEKFSKMEESFERIKSEVKLFEDRIGAQKNDGPGKELEIRLSDVSQQLEDLDARVGGLEKAFKQFLPSLTRNIESLSQLVHEIKEKTHLQLEEEL
jgi:hypothetical protein